MSEGITPYDFVQQVYYAQEKVLLDFWPTDDKYREVLVEANLVLQELQNAEDWTWLREQLVLGSCHHVPNEIPEFELPDWVYKPSMTNHDVLRLHPIINPHVERGRLHHHGPFAYNERYYIGVPFASAGDNRYPKRRQYDPFQGVDGHDHGLRAVKIGNVITFNRPLLPHEERTVAVMDVQRRIEQFHVCDGSCSLDADNKCPKAKDVYLTEIPDPNYVIMATAARHAEGSPPALARVAGLQDAAQKIMSAMRQNDSAATDADYADWDTVGYLEVV